MLGEYFGWAIEHRKRGTLPEPPWLLGPYTCNDAIPPHMEGHHVALFKTRALARAALPKRWSVNGSHHRYVPVKVHIVISKIQ